MPNNYVLIDFENLQPENLSKLVGLPVIVYVFVGENQAKLTFEFAAAMQKLGSSAHYIRIAGNGPNALDFHIAYYVGELSTNDPTAFFHIISNDTGFDPLIAHLLNRPTPLRIYRVSDLEKIPIVRRVRIGSLGERTALVIENFKKRGASLPKKVSSLESTIHAHFGKTLLDTEVRQLVGALQKAKVLSVADGNVQYHLTAEQPSDTMEERVPSG